MRVLLVDWGTTMRGGQWQCLYLFRGLAKLGIEAKLLARGELLRHAGEEAGVRALHRLSKWADIVHVQDARSHSLASLLSHAPVVVSRRVAFPVGQGIVSRWKYRRACRFIAVSRYVAAKLTEAGVPSERIDVIYDGVPIPDQESARTIPLVALRTGDPMKGDDLLRRAAERANVEVRWTDRLADDVRRTRVFAYLTESEGLGSAALLAMAHGVAVVASRVGGLPEAVEHGRTGLLASNDPVELGGVLQEAMNTPGLAERLGRCGREVAKARFSVERMVNETLGVYRRVLG